MSHADLTDAKLARTNLKNADLIQTDLTRADLTGAKLAKANIDGAIFTGAVGVDRSRARPGPQPRQGNLRCEMTLMRWTLLPGSLRSPPARGGERPQGRPTRRRADDTAAATSRARRAELAYVTNEGSEELTIIDTAQRQRRGDSIPVGTRPRGVRVTPGREVRSSSR